MRTANTIAVLVGMLAVLTAGCTLQAQPVTQVATGDTGIPTTGGSASESAVAYLAAIEGVESASIQVISVEQVEWPDASLGAAQPGSLYAQVITPGYRVKLRLAGRDVELHGDGEGRWVPVKEPASPARPSPYHVLQAVLLHVGEQEDVSALGPAEEWLLEDLTPPGAPGKQIWVWRHGPWQAEVSQASRGSSDYDVVVTHEQRGVIWRGAVDSLGVVIPPDEPGEDAADALLRSLLRYYAEVYPGFGLPSPSSWRGSNVTMNGAPGDRPQLWQSGAWALLVAELAESDSGHSVLLSHADAGIVWRGTRAPSGQVVAERPVLFSWEAEPCDPAISPEGLAGWQGADFRAHDGQLVFTHRLRYVCCAELAVSAGRDGRVIRVLETNLGEVCRCSCGYEIQGEITGLETGDYTIEIWGVQHESTPQLSLLAVAEVSVP